MAGNKIKERREELKISQEDLAKACGVSRSIISGLETGKFKSTTVRTMVALSKALQMPVSELFML